MVSAEATTPPRQSPFAPLTVKLTLFWVGALHSPETVMGAGGLASQGKTFEQTARETGLSANTLRKPLWTRAAPAYRPRAHRVTKRDAFNGRVASAL